MESEKRKLLTKQDYVNIVIGNGLVGILIYLPIGGILIVLML